MNTPIEEALEQLDNFCHFGTFKHNGKVLSKKQIRAILEYARKNHYDTTAELTDYEVELVLDATNWRDEEHEKMVKESALKLKNGESVIIKDGDSTERYLLAMQIRWWYLLEYQMPYYPHFEMFPSPHFNMSFEHKELILSILNTKTGAEQ